MNIFVNNPKRSHLKVFPRHLFFNQGIIFLPDHEMNVDRQHRSLFVLENERRLLQRLDHHQVAGLGFADEQDLVRQDRPDLERPEIPDVAEEVEMGNPVAGLSRRS